MPKNGGCLPFREFVDVVLVLIWVNVRLQTKQECIVFHIGKIMTKKINSLSIALFVLFKLIKLYEFLELPKLCICLYLKKNYMSEQCVVCPTSKRLHSGRLA